MTTKRQARAERRARLAAARARAAAETTGAAAPATDGEPLTVPFHREALASLALAGIVIAAFFPAFSAGFVWDDVIFTDEPVVQSVGGLREIWFSPREIKKEGHYWPLVYTSFWLEYRLWGLKPLGFHLTNVLLYVANVLLLWRLLRRLAVPAAWAVAVLWAVHPLHVESVVWVIERKDVLSGLLFLASALAYVGFDKSGGLRRYSWSLLLFALGLLSKTAIVTLPASLLIWHWWKRGRLTRDDFLRTGPFFLVGFAVTLADLAFYRSREALDLGYSLVERVLIGARALWFYAGKLVWPSDLAVIYPLWEIRAGELFAWLFVVGAAAVPAALWLGRRRFGRGPLAGVLFFGVTLFPVLGFLDYGYMQYSFVADRFQYLASIGLLVVAAAAAHRVAVGLGRSYRLAARAILALALIVLGTLTWRHATVFRCDLTLFSHVVSLNPEARDAYHNLSGALARAGRFEESVEASLAAVALRPDHAGAHSNLGLARMHLGRLDEAEPSLRRALEYESKNRDTMQNLAEVLRRQRRLREAVEVYRAVIEIDADYALAHAGLGNALFELKRYDEALAALNRGLALETRAPESDAPGAYDERGFTLRLIAGQAARGSGDYEQAERHIRRAMELIPDRTEPLVELAELRVRQERPEEAEEFFERALELDPAEPRALDYLAMFRFQAGRHEEALELYRRRVEAGHDDAQTYVNMGVTLNSLERYEEAEQSLGRALERDPEHELARNLLGEIRRVLE